MCGISAVLCSSFPKALQKILLSGKYLSTRGPDQSLNIVKSNGIYMFHRLSINDVSNDGMQPFISKSSTGSEILMMCNGEIYNHKELEQEFDLQCKSKSDCEVILRLYEKIGFVETVKKLYGVFAIILVDGDQVYLARDRIGVRPLYFGLTEEKFLAVSSVPNCLTDFCHPVVHFPPGATCLHVKSDPSGKILQFLYMDEVVIPSLRITNGMTALHDTLVNAVKLRLMSDRPMGCLLSGGLDSSLISAILVRFLGAKNVRTYSIGMEGSTDLAYARKVAMFLGTEHHEVLFTPEEGFVAIPEVIKALASYDITTVRASVGMYLLAKYISKTSQDKVIFSGEGSDEILQGYLYFHNAPTSKDGEEESLRLVKELHTYDVLRADRCISVHGLEARVPFLDRKMVNVAMALPVGEKCPYNKIEKYILRKAFDTPDNPYLPEEVLWRKKEAFSDGVSSSSKSWYQNIQEMVDPLIPDYLFNPNFPSKEAQYYKMIFDNIFPAYNVKIPYWLPKWNGDVKDPSARVLKIYEQ